MQNSEGAVVWKGYYVGDKKDGPGAEFWDSGIKKFEGMYENGHKVSGTEHYENGLVLYFANKKLRSCIKVNGKMGCLMGPVLNSTARQGR
jgi:antitoxin component YwqK of YwqJK toxin-antitoxin module